MVFAEEAVGLSRDLRRWDLRPPRILEPGLLRSLVSLFTPGMDSKVGSRLFPPAVDSR